MSKQWTKSQMAAGYAAMAALNAQLAEEFAPLEEEAAAIIEGQWAAAD